MARQFLYPQRRRFEILSAVYAGGFGVYIWSESFIENPIAWTGVDINGALAIGQLMTLAALLHTLGVRINGEWRWSPVLRLAGMTCHALIFAFLAWQGAGTSAAYTYTWGVALLIYGASSAARDTFTAIRGAEWNLR